MTEKEEEYLHRYECIWSLNDAWRILQDLRCATSRTAIHAAAYRYALIAYAKVYTRSDGEHKKGRAGYLLPIPALSQDDLALHQRILKLRHQVLAHSDLNVKQAEVYVGRYGGQPQTIMSFNSLPDFPEVDTVIGLIERTLDLLYTDYDQLEQDLAPTS